MYNNWMLTNIDIDDELVAQAMKVSGARTKREVVDRALREMVSRSRRPSVGELFGIGGVDPDYDPKAPWAHGHEVGQYRVEEPRAIYAVKAAAVKTAAVKSPKAKPTKPKPANPKPANRSGKT